MVWKILGGFSFSFLVCGWEWRRRRTMLRPAPVNVNPFGGKYSPVHINNWPLQLFLATCRYWKRTAGSSSFSLFPWMLFYFKGRLFFFFGVQVLFSATPVLCALCACVKELERSVLSLTDRARSLLGAAPPVRSSTSRRFVVLDFVFFFSFFLSFSFCRPKKWLHWRTVCLFFCFPAEQLARRYEFRGSSSSLALFKWLSRAPALDCFGLFSLSGRKQKGRREK